MLNDLIISTEQSNVFAKAAGDPETPLVLGVHGWSKRNGWQTWEPLLAPMGQAGFYAVSVDMPGWGRSEPWAGGPLTMDNGVEALTAIIKSLKKNRAVIMGKSWGGGIAIETAMRHPRLISKLILSAPAFRDLDRLSKLSPPVLLAWSKDDPVIPYKYARKYEATVPNIQLVTYDNGGHSAAPNNDGNFTPVAIEFLRS